jgi:nucleoside-diphosphate kinase
MEFEKEQTLVIVKPDGVQRSLIGEIIQRIERTGLKFVAFKLVVPTRDQVIAHYHKDEVWFQKKGARVIEDRTAHGLPVEKVAIDYGRDIIEGNVKFMTSGPVLAFIVEGAQSVGIIKKLVGGTEPLTSDVGTIRGDLTVDSYAHSSVSNRAVRNLIHCSDSPEEALREIPEWFKPEEVVKYRLVQEQILYDVNIDGVLE